MAKKDILLLLSSVLAFIPSLLVVPASSSAAGLSGSYGIARMVAGFPGSTEAMVLAGSGSITFNSNGSCSAVLKDTEYGLNLMTGTVTPYPDNLNLPCSYATNSNGDLALTFTGDTVSYQGTLSADGSSFNLAGPDSDTAAKVQLLVGHKSGSGMNNASLTGSYGFARTVAGFPSATESSSMFARGTITFDGSGSCSANVQETGFSLDRSTGTITQWIPSLNDGTDTCGYSVGSDGGVTLTFTFNENTFSYQGNVSADGSSFALAGSAQATEDRVTLMVGNKVGTGMSATSLKGSYGIARSVLGFSSGTEAMALAGRGAITFDGNGKCSASLIDTEYALQLPSGPAADYSGAANLFCSYSVTAAGDVTLTFAGDSISYEGNISADGSFFFLVGRDSEFKAKIMLLTGQKLGSAYPSADMAGTWKSAGIKTPIKGTSDPDNFGYDVDSMIIYADGSGSVDPLSTSDPSPTESLPAGSATIPGDGILSANPDNNYSYMNAGKDVRFMFFIDPEDGEQQLFVDLKQAESYSTADLAGTWMSPGIKTPAKLNSDPDNFGYDVDRMVLAADGSGSVTTIDSSDSTAGELDQFPAGTIRIAADGKISTDDPNDHFYMNASKDVMFQFRIDPVVGEQQLFVNVKKGAGYTMQDLAGNWYGAGIKTPVKGNTTATFGYEVAKLALNADGSGLSTPISSSKPKELWFPTAYFKNNFKIESDGTITTFSSNEFFFLNAGKNVLVQFKKDPYTGEQQLFVYLKQAAAPELPVAQPVDGSCGTANGASFDSAPGANLCSSGTASSVTGSGPWSWSCNGENGGATASCSANINTWSLSLTVTGSGSGTVNSSPSYISCSSNSTSGCSASFKSGQTVQLFATPSAGSLFSSWSGSISGTTTPVTVVMNGNKTVTATFTAAAKVKVGSKTFPTLQAAYDDIATVSGSVIKLLEGFLPGNFTAGRNIDVKVVGGYNATFDAIASTTTVQSPFMVKTGLVRVQGVRIRPQ